MKIVISVLLVQFYVCVLGRQALNVAQIARRYQVMIPPQQQTSQNAKIWGTSDMIFPGTLWCGPGDIAHNYTHLGSLVKVDKCCRTHDRCGLVILTGTSEHGLSNTGSFTRLHCNCDEKFRKCLLATKSKTADAIGYIYFNKMGFQCFKREYPVTGCLRREGFIVRKCVKYSYNTRGRKIYQWFDVQFYRGNERFNEHPL